MSELQKATERLRQFRRFYEHDEGEDPYAFGDERQAKDLVRTSNECLRLMDETPIDEAWLLSAGFTHRHPHPISREKSLIIDDLEVWAFLCGDGWEWGAHWGTTLLREIATRGDVRLLAVALSIELKE